MLRHFQIVREVLKDVKIKNSIIKVKYTNFLGYQALNESLKWLRDNELRYGKNPTYDLDCKQSNEIDNPQPSP
jgi:hypothetical protein